MIILYNTLSRQKEEFKPLVEGEVGIYACGPTVYDSVHIGNLRAYIDYDLIRKVLIRNGLKVKEVMNITDVDDKTIRKSVGVKEKFLGLIKKYEEKFWLDVSELNIDKPEFTPRATDYIEKMVKFIKDLLDGGYAYRAEDGSVYFSIEKFKNYGELSRLDKQGLKSGARVAQDEYSKENPADFALWKKWDENDGDIFWESELGKGRPGWSIECSTMSTDLLGNTLDIHTGGVDLMFPHHENEIAQSEARTGKKFVNYWIHNEHLLVDNTKMSKSLNNYYTLDDIKNKGFSPLAFRYLVLGAHYRSKINFTWEALKGAESALQRIRDLRNRGEGIDKQKRLKVAEEIDDCLNDDLNTSEVLAILHKNNDFGLWKEFDSVLALDVDKVEEIPEEVTKLVKKREEARISKDWEVSDKMRKDIEKMGFGVEDGADGPSIVKL